MSEYIRIRKEKLEELKLIAKKENVSIKVIDEGHFTYEGSKRRIEYFSIVLTANQDSESAKVIAFANIEGQLLSLDSNFTWTEERYKQLDFTRCDRCNKSIQRKKIWVVKLTNGNIIQVGGGCADQLNCEKRVKQLIDRIKNVTNKIDSDFYGFGNKNITFDPNVILNDSAKVIKTFGYVKTRDEYGNENDHSTKNDVLYINSKPIGKLEERRKEEFLSKINKYGSDNIDWYAKVEDWLKDQKWSDYTQNVENALKTGSIKLIGVLVSVPYIILKEERRKEEEKKIEESIKNAIIPEEDQKIDIEAEVLWVKIEESYYGDIVKLTLIDKRYGKLWLNTTAKWVWEVKKGDIIKGKVKVKKVYNKGTSVKTSSRSWEVLTDENNETRA